MMSPGVSLKCGRSMSEKRGKGGMARGVPSIEKHRWGLYLANSVTPISVKKYSGSDTVQKDEGGLKESIWGLTS